MKEINQRIILRPVAPEEEIFWKEVFFDSVRAHFSILNLAEYQLSALLEMQYAAQKADYGKNYPKAENDLILYDGAPAGRVILTTERGDLHLVDIVVLSKYRNLGIGTEILNWLFERSRQTKMPVRFSVERNNRAFRLYERLGFKIVGEMPAHFQMEWRAASAADET